MANEHRKTELHKDSVWNQLLTYCYLRKRNEHAPRNINLKMMHGMNRISILLFLIAVLVMLYRLLF